MAFKGYKFSLIVGHPVGRRGIGFLEEIVEEQDGESSLDAKSKFDSLEIKKERELRSKFDYWLSAAPPNDKWFHGWPNASGVTQIRPCRVS